MASIFNFPSANDSQVKYRTILQTFLQSKISTWQDFWNLDQSEHIIGPGSHVEFPISINLKNLVKEHLPNISAQFGWNLFGGFREEDENVKFP